MSIISIEELEIATNIDIAEDDIPFYQWYIDVVSAYIEDATGMSFTEQEAEDLICQSDRYGIIEFRSLTSVESVEEHDPWTGLYTDFVSGSDYAFDGIKSIYSLAPYTTYRVSVTYGYEAAPLAIKGIVADLVAAGSGLDPDATNGLKAYRVGDVEEQYGVVTDGSGRPMVTLSGLQSATLARYGKTTTWRL